MFRIVVQLEGYGSPTASELLQVFFQDCSVISFINLPITVFDCEDGVSRIMWLFFCVGQKLYFVLGPCSTWLLCPLWALQQTAAWSLFASFNAKATVVAWVLFAALTNVVMVNEKNATIFKIFFPKHF